MWNVFATPELSLTPRQWCFPIAGCVNYRGYFHEAEARGEAARLKAAGDDVYVGGVPAYSTLGWFDDPVLSSFVRWPETEVARLIFHELAHQVLYVKDDTAVQRVVRGRRRGGGRRAAGSRSARQPAARRAVRAHASGCARVFRDLVRDTRARLVEIYASTRAGRRQAARQGRGASRQ